MAKEYNPSQEVFHVTTCDLLKGRYSGSAHGGSNTGISIYSTTQGITPDGTGAARGNVYITSAVTIGNLSLNDYSSN